MKKLVLALTAASALAAAAAPAAAQPYGGGYERHQRYDNDHRHRGNQHHLDTGRPVRLTPGTLQSIDRTVPTIAFPVPIAEASAHLPTL